MNVNSLLLPFTKFVRNVLAGPDTDFVFSKPQAEHIPPVGKSGIYVHVPFCRQLCPYCPYNRIPYDKTLAQGYVNAVIKEIRHYGKHLTGMEASSVYFGGGTPTIIREDLIPIVQALRDNFNINGPLCIETNPQDLTQEKVAILKKIGMQSISLGVQSFNPKFIQLIGRSYSTRQIYDSLGWLCEAGFDTINVDLMFALPGQTLADLEGDLRKTTELGIDQVTTYPLFTFPYSTVGLYKKSKHVVMPSIRRRRRMYYLVYEYLASLGYERASVWAFKKAQATPRYSSVTRERYVGFGPGAGSYFGPKFTLNTFSVADYINAVNFKGSAVALEMPFGKRLSTLYDIYWRIYDTYIPKKRKIENLSYAIDEVTPIATGLRIAKLFGMLDEHQDHFSLTQRGALWIHLLQNYFSLRYINSIWTKAKKEPWPAQIRF